MTWGKFSWYMMGTLTPEDYHADQVHPFMLTVDCQADGSFQYGNAKVHQA